MSAGDLTTLAKVRQFLGKPADTSTQTGDDALLTALIGQASKAIHSYTGREFAPLSTASQTRVFSYYGGGRLYFTPYDASTISSVTIDTETDTSTTLTVDEDYFLFPRNAPAGVYEFMELRGCEPGRRTSASVNRPWREVTVVGTWGFASVPADVELAANMQVAFLFRNHSTIPGSDTGDQGTRFGPVNLASGVMQLLAPYRVIGFGYGG